jgi:hypothetical protein
MQSIIISLIVLVLGASSALADVVTKCNSPQGYTYFIAGAAIPKKEAGWAPDSISKEATFLLAMRTGSTT